MTYDEYIAYHLGGDAGVEELLGVTEIHRPSKKLSELYEMQNRQGKQ